VPGVFSRLRSAATTGAAGELGGGGLPIVGQLGERHADREGSNGCARVFSDLRRVAGVHAVGV